jgi:pantothenate kinase-related protein Tda10
VNNFSIKNITGYANKVNKKVIAYQTILGYIDKIKKMQMKDVIRKEELF